MTKPTKKTKKEEVVTDEAKIASLEATLAEKNNIIVFLASLILSIESKVNELDFLHSPRKLNFLTLLRNAPKIIELIIFILDQLKSFRQNVIINEEPKNENQLSN